MRFLNLMYVQHFFRKKTFRQTIEWTSKMRLVVCISCIIAGSCLIAANILTNNFVFTVAVLVVVLMGFPVIIALSILLLSPVDRLMKLFLLSKAKRVIGSYDSLIVIGITGSYGKTSMKEMVTYMIGGEKKVLVAGGNINTPIGISRLILSCDLDKYDVFVVEMGAFVPGDIKELCELVSPEIGIITGITKQHLERFGSLEAIAKTKRELAESVQARGGTVYLNTTDSMTQKALEDAGIEIDKPDIVVLSSLPNTRYIDGFGGVSFEHNGKDIKIPLLAKYSTMYCKISLMVGTDILGVSMSSLISRCATIPYVKHRLEPIFNKTTGITVIDDSYNGNISGIHAVIDLMKHQCVVGKKVYLSPGIVELGNDTHAVHYELGKELAGVFELYLFVNNTGTQALKKGLIDTGVDQSAIIFFDSAGEAHASLGGILHSGDCIVFQNDATDNYL